MYNKMLLLQFLDCGKDVLCEEVGFRVLPLWSHPLKATIWCSVVESEIIVPKLRCEVVATSMI